MDSSLFDYAVTSGTNGAAETPANAYNIRQLNETLIDKLSISLASNALTFGTTAVYLMNVKCAHRSASGTRFVHRLHKSAVAVGLPSTPAITNGITTNWISQSCNIISITAADVYDIRNKTNSVTSSLRGLATGTGTEIYLQVEIEKVTDYALFYYSKAANTAGDNEVTSYTGRALTQSVNNITSLSLATDTITFPPGTYRIRTLATHFGANGRKFVSKFVDASTPAIGNGVSNVVTETKSYLTVAAATTTAVQFKSKADSITGTPTMGKQGNQGEIEMYGWVEIVKLY